ncbi:MAG: ATP-binding cassette domain-containing protein [Myxococcota bacterium]
MGPSGLEARFREALAFRGTVASAAGVRYATDLARLLVRVCVGNPDELERRREPIKAAVAQRTELSPAEVEILVGIAEAPEFRAIVDVREIDAFGARFGEPACRALLDEDAADLDLPGFARTYGSGMALLLLDAIFGVIAADDGRIDTSELRRIETAASELGLDGVVLAALQRRHDPVLSGAEVAFPLAGQRLRVGRSPGCDVVLHDPQVAPWHCTLQRVEDTWRVVDADSGRPTVVNGRPITSAPLHQNDLLRVGPFALRLDGDRLVARNERSFAALEVGGLTRKIGETFLLDDVRFTVFAGEVVAMVGPSGAGKTTLLNAIAGITPADTGTVRMDGRDFHEILGIDRARVGVVPQDDIVLPELTVAESLYFSGRLRLPPRAPDSAVKDEVRRVLGELGIEHIRGSRIGDALRRGISGGQRKRVNLGQEMLTPTTRVLFLDEPTSGLDPRAAQDIVRLVRQLADRGRIVFLVTHDLTPQVMAQVDHLLVLAPGGRVAFFGPPAEACGYFNVQTPDAIFNRFGDKAPAEWGAAFRASPAWQKYVAVREELLKLPIKPASDAGKVTPVATSTLQQLHTLVRRYWRVKVRDRTGLWVLAAQPPFLALVMAVVFPRPTTQMIFMLSLSCLWFGMSLSVRELINDRVVWRRERRVGVGVLPYVGSKLAVLGTLVVAQCAFLSSLDWLMFRLWDYGFNPVALSAVCALTGLVGMTLGLAVSSIFTSSEAAVGTLPLLLIPQITFSSLLVGIRDMSGFARLFTWIDPQRYAFDATLKVGAKLEKATRVPGEWTTQTITGPLYELGLKGADASDMGLSLVALCAALVGFCALFGGVAFVRVWSREE